MYFIMDFLLICIIFAPFVFAFIAKWFIDKLKSNYDGDIDENRYWGSSRHVEEEEEDDNEPINQLAKSKRQFTISISDEQIADLKWRLEHLRPLTPSLELVAQEYGINSELLNKIVEFWKTKYDWKQREIYFNQFPQYKLNIQGLDIHFIHVQPTVTFSTKKVLPLLIVHSWPGSIREFYKIISLYTTRIEDDFVFEVIAPHIPGFGFSEATNKPGLGATEIAIIFHQLMLKLDFNKYYCQGGGIGAVILQSLCALHPESVLGYHTSMPYIVTKQSLFKYALSLIWPSVIVRKEHYNRVFPFFKRFGNFLNDYGFLQLQISKPDTLGVALNDSPVGLAAYILDKFITGTHSHWKNRIDGGLLEKYNIIDLLDIVMVYWWTGTATTSLRFFAETFNFQSNRIPREIIVPVAVARFKHDFYIPDGILNDIFPHLEQLNDYTDGGHFPAFERPDVLADDVFIAVKKFETYNDILYIKETTKNVDENDNNINSASVIDCD